MQTADQSPWHRWTRSLRRYHQSPLAHSQAPRNWKITHAHLMSSPPTGPTHPFQSLPQRILTFPTTIILPPFSFLGILALLAASTALSNKAQLRCHHKTTTATHPPLTSNPSLTHFRRLLLQSSPFLWHLYVLSM